MRAYILYSRYIKRLLLALHYYTGTAVLVVVRSQTFLLLVLRNLSSAPLSTMLIVVSLLRTTRILIILYQRVLTCLRGMTSQNSSYGDHLPVGHSCNIIYAYIRVLYCNIMYTILLYYLQNAMYAPFNDGRAGSAYTLRWRSRRQSAGEF